MTDGGGPVPPVEDVAVDIERTEILIVDDDPGNLLALEGLLEPRGYRILLARSGEEALEILPRSDPAVVLLDVRMPGMGGFETARRIRQLGRNGGTPIIFLTGATAELGNALQGYEAGAVDYLVKPLVPEILLSKVAIFVELHRKSAALNREIRERRAAEQAARKSERQLRALTARLVSVREEEGRRIAREIHDELGQLLTGLKLDVTWLARHLEPAQHALRAKTETMADLIDSTMRLVRRISTRLRPEVLDEMGLVEAIEWQATDFQRRTGIRCRLNLPRGAMVPGNHIASSVFRMFQEALTNVARHARASSVDVGLNIAAHRLVLDVADDGIGISPESIDDIKSLGLLGLHERTQLLGGEVRIGARDGRGTRVVIDVPIAADALRSLP